MIVLHVHVDHGWQYPQVHVTKNSAYRQLVRAVLQTCLGNTGNHCLVRIFDTCSHGLYLCTIKVIQICRHVTHAVRLQLQDYVLLIEFNPFTLSKLISIKVSSQNQDIIMHASLYKRSRAMIHKKIQFGMLPNSPSYDQPPCICGCPMTYLCLHRQEIGHPDKQT